MDKYAKESKTTPAATFRYTQKNLVLSYFLVNLKTTLTFCRKLIYIIKVFDRNKTCQRKLNNKKLVCNFIKKNFRKYFFL